MKKVLKQELDYSCGAFALMNCLDSLGYKISEQRVREFCNTTENGTSSNGIIRCILKFKLDYKEIYSISSEHFLKRLIYPCIILTDNTEHWIAGLKKYNRKYLIMDSLYKETEKAICKNELLALARNLERDTGKIYYYAICIKKEVISPL